MPSCRVRSHLVDWSFFFDRLARFALDDTFCKFKYCDYDFGWKPTTDHKENTDARTCPDPLISSKRRAM